MDEDEYDPEYDESPIENQSTIEPQSQFQNVVQNEPPDESFVTVADPKAQLVIGAKVQISRRKGIGVIKYVGKTHFSEGDILYGIELEQRKGYNNGSKDGQEYFQAKPRHGMFCSVQAIEFVAAPRGSPRHNYPDARNVYVDRDNDNTFSLTHGNQHADEYQNNFNTDPHYERASPTRGPVNVNKWGRNQSAASQISHGSFFSKLFPKSDSNIQPVQSRNANAASSQNTTTSASPEKKGSYDWILWVLLAMVIVTAIALTCYFLVLKKTAKSDVPKLQINETNTNETIVTLDPTSSLEAKSASHASKTEGNKKTRIISPNNNPDSEEESLRQLEQEVEKRLVHTACVENLSI